MLTFWLKCEKDIKNVNSKVIKTKKWQNNVIIKSRFMKEQQAKELLSSLSLKTPLKKIHY